jgi:hypothetical protein
VPVDAIRGLLLITVVYIFGVRTVRKFRFWQPNIRTRTDLRWLSFELYIRFRLVARFIKATPRTLNWISASDELWPRTVSMLLKRARMLVVDASGITTTEINAGAATSVSGLTYELKQAELAQTRVLVLYDSNMVSLDAISLFLQNNAPALRALILPYGQDLNSDLAAAMRAWR